MYIDRAEAFRGTRVLRIRNVQNHFVPSLRERERESQRKRERDREKETESLCAVPVASRVTRGPVA